MKALRRQRAILAVVIAFLFVPSTILAQELARSRRVMLDNDYFVFWLPPRQRPDDNYTQGVRVAWDMVDATTPWHRLVCRQDRSCGAMFELGQERYTPTVDSPMPFPGERPYAGWLYGRLATRAGTARTFRSLGMTIGVTGPPSLAEASQKALHRLVPSFRTPLGWEHQLATEVAFAIRGERAWHIALPGPAARWTNFVPTAQLTLGTLRTSAGMRTRANAGIGLPHPWLASRNPPRLALNAFIGGGIELVAHDLFLDGNTFSKSTQAERKPVVGSWERGLSVTVRRLKLEYLAVTRSREYRAGPRSHTYGSIGVHWIVR